jgi:uncharacterized protein YjiS (DUF1127 family)
MIGISVVRALRRWNARENVRRELSAMDDRQLADIGLSRGDIELVAHGKLTRNGHVEAS